MSPRIGTPLNTYMSTFRCLMSLRGTIHLSNVFIHQVLQDDPTPQPVKKKSLSVFQFYFQWHKISIKNKSLNHSLHTWNTLLWGSRSQRVVNCPCNFHLSTAILLSLPVFSQQALLDPAFTLPNLHIVSSHYGFFALVSFCCLSSLIGF